MCNGPIHRPLNGLVDPFSTFHFLSSYNRLVRPTDLSQYYNSIAMIKEKDRLLSLQLQPKPIDILLGNNAATINNNNNNTINTNNNTKFSESSLFQNEINHRTFVNQSPNRTVSSTTYPSTTTPTTLAENIIIDHSLGSVDQLIPNDLLKGDNSLESYQGFLSRRQRGEKRPIPDEQKDEKYFERRKRNNEAAKKSRDARKIREDRIAFRAAVLEQENAILRTQIIALREEITTLRDLLCTTTRNSTLPPINV